VCKKTHTSFLLKKINRVSEFIFQYLHMSKYILRGGVHCNCNTDAETQQFILFSSFIFSISLKVIK